MKQSAWMTTGQMLDALHQDPGHEHEFHHRVSGILCSTYWWMYDPATDRYGVSTDWREYEWCSRDVMAQSYDGEWWKLIV